MEGGGYAAVLEEKLADSAQLPLPELTSRRLRGRLSLPGKASAVVGMRRVGKTSLLQELRIARHRAGTLQAHLPYLNFEDERLAGLTAEHLPLALDAFYRRFPALRGGERPVLWCLDEIQVVPGWERFVRRLLDSEAVEVFVTGSSAALLSREIATALRGRAWTVALHPFSFEEALRHAGQRAESAQGGRSARQRSRLEKALLDYLEVGGFPEVQGLDIATRRRLLRDYVDVAMLRDVIERHGVSNTVALRWLVRHVLGNAACLFSVERFHRTLKSQGIPVSRDTLHEILSHLEDCFLVRTVWMESSSERQRMVNPRKTYPVDPGLIPLFERSGKSNLGHALETAVLIELERRHAEVTYVKSPSGYEVDFLARYPDGSCDLVQVCADAAHGDTGARELRALAEARRVHGDARALLLVANQAGRPAEVPEGIEVVAAWEWLLS